MPANLRQNENSMTDFFQNEAYQNLAGQGFSLGELGAGAQQRGQNFGVERAAYNLLDDEGNKTGMDALLTGNGGLAWGYIDPAWTGLQRIQPRDQQVAPPAEPATEPTLGPDIVPSFYYGADGNRVDFLSRNRQPRPDELGTESFGDYTAF